jgi:RimJ/RimL family protein N-acetyltransferase
VSAPLLTRPVVESDADGLIALVGAAYAEHPGCVLDLPGVDADLLRPAAAVGDRGGRWWVVEADGAGIVATIGAGPLDEQGDVELKRLYVAAPHRRRGIAADLVARVEAHAADLSARRVVLWSDTRFADAHRLYRRLGYVDTGRRRDLHDPSKTTEINFVRPL